MDTFDSARGCTVSGLLYLTHSSTTLRSSSVSAYRPGSYIKPRETPAAPCCNAFSKMASICVSSSAVSFLFSKPATAALAEQWPTRAAMLQGVLWSMAAKYSSTVPYSPVVSWKKNNPPPILSTYWQSFSKPTVDRPQLPATNVVSPCRMKGSKYGFGFFLMANQSLWECASIKPEETDLPSRFMTLSASASIQGATRTILSSSINTSPTNASAPVPS